MVSMYLRYSSKESISSMRSLMQLNIASAQASSVEYWELTHTSLRQSSMS